MGIKLNLTQDEIKAAQSTIPKPLAEGTYGALIFTAEVKESKAKNPMYVIDFKITDGPEGINRKIKSWFVIMPTALFSVNRLLKALGLPYPDKDTAEGEFEFPDPDGFVGEKVNLKIVQEPYQTVNEDDEEITAYRNTVKAVYAYDEDKHTVEGETSDSSSGGLFL